MSHDTPEVIKARARKSTLVAVLMGLFLPPLAYVYVGKWTWAVVNLLTVNFALAGVVVVPLHTVASIKDARTELQD